MTFLSTASYIVPKIVKRRVGPWHFDKFATAVVTRPVAIICDFNSKVSFFVVAPPKMSST